MIVTHEIHMSLVSGFPTRSNTNRALQSLNMARGLKFQIHKVEGLYYPCSENKGADQLRGTIRVAKTKALISFAVTAKLICVFVFAYTKIRFCHDEAHIL